jgi:hypothetical protein
MKDLSHELWWNARVRRVPGAGDNQIVGTVSFKVPFGCAS